MDHRALFIWSCALLQILFLAVDAAVAPGGKGAKYLCECYLRQLKKSTDLTWTPGRNFHENTTDGDMRKLYGYSKNLMNARTVGKKDSEPAKIFGKKTEDKLYPENFDSRDHWPACNSTISTIFDTGFCASHWAASVVQAISDRICIHSGGKKKNLKLSPLHPLQCCKTCGSGCKGGYPFQAWKFIEKSGIMTGGDYGSSDGCKPYPIQSPCDYSTYPNSCILKKTPVLTCPNPDKHCSTKETKPHIYNIDLVRTIPNSDQFTQAWTADFIKQEIISNGPVTATMRLFSDFFSYKKGIYSPTKDARKLDDVTLKVIGWGRDRQKKIDYWLGVMPWGNKFGDGGFVKIRQGVSQLQIDRRMHAGVPQLH